MLTSLFFFNCPTIKKSKVNQLIIIYGKITPHRNLLFKCIISDLVYKFIE